MRGTAWRRAVSKRGLIRDPFLHGLVEELVAVASVALGPVHGDVGVGEELLRRLGPVGGQRDADARTHAGIVVPEAKRRPEHADDALCHVGRLLDAFDVLAQHDELIAPEACDRVGLTYRRLDAGGGLGEELVAHRVTERVVHGLEPIQVDVEHPAHAAVPPHPGERLVEPVGQHHPVPEARQRVVHGLEGELSFEALLVRQISNDSRDNHGVPFTGDGAGGHGHGELRPVAPDPGDLDVVALGGDGARRPAGRQEDSEVFVEGGWHQAEHPTSDDLGFAPAEDRLGGTVERQDRPVQGDGEDPLGGVLDDGPVMGLPAQRLVPGMGQLVVRPLLGLAECPGHDHHDRKGDRSQETHGLRFRAAQERGHPTLEHEKLAHRAAHQRPPEHRPPRRRAGLMEIHQRRVDEAQAEGGPPTGQVDHRQDGDRMQAHADMQAPRAPRRMRPPVEALAHQRRAGDRRGVRPPRLVGHDSEVAAHEHDHQRHHLDRVQQDHGRGSAPIRGRSGGRARARRRRAGQVRGEPRPPLRSSGRHRHSQGSPEASLGRPAALGANARPGSTGGPDPSRRRASGPPGLARNGPTGAGASSPGSRSTPAQQCGGTPCRRGGLLYLSGLHAEHCEWFWTTESSCHHGRSVQVKKVIASLVLAGSVAMGSAGVAAAAPSPGCANAPATIARLTAQESHVASVLASLHARVPHGRRQASRLERRIAFLTGVEGRLAARVGRVQAQCTTSSGGSGGGTVIS